MKATCTANELKHPTNSPDSYERILENTHNIC